MGLVENCCLQYVFYPSMISLVSLQSSIEGICFLSPYGRAIKNNPAATWLWFRALTLFSFCFDERYLKKQSTQLKESIDHSTSFFSSWLQLALQPRLLLCFKVSRIEDVIADSLTKSGIIKWLKCNISAVYLKVIAVIESETHPCSHVSHARIPMTLSRVCCTFWWPCIFIMQLFESRDIVY